FALAVPPILKDIDCSPDHYNQNNQRRQISLPPLTNLGQYSLPLGSEAGRSNTNKDHRIKHRHLLHSSRAFGPRPFHIRGENRYLGIGIVFGVACRLGLRSCSYSRTRRSRSDSRAWYASESLVRPIRSSASMASLRRRNVELSATTWPPPGPASAISTY